MKYDAINNKIEKGRFFNSFNRNKSFLISMFKDVVIDKLTVKLFLSPDSYVPVTFKDTEEIKGFLKQFHHFASAELQTIIEGHYPDFKRKEGVEEKQEELKKENHSHEGSVPKGTAEKVEKAEATEKKNHIKDEEVEAFVEMIGMGFLNRKMECKHQIALDPIWTVEAIKAGIVTVGDTLEVKDPETPDIDWTANVGDYVLRDSKGKISTYGAKSFEENFVAVTPLVKIHAGVDGEYKNGDYTFRWDHDYDYCSGSDFSNTLIDFKDKDFIDMKISNDREDSLTIEEANELIKPYGFVIVE